MSQSSSNQRSASRHKRKNGKTQQSAVPNPAVTPVVIETAKPPVELPSVPSAPTVWRVAAAAVQGVSHARLDLPCQDVTGYRLLDNGMLVIALADGAGTARCAEQGARLAVDETLRMLGEVLSETIPVDDIGWQGLILEAFASARELVWQLAEESGEAPREYASTLTGVILTPDRVIAGQIGDGAVVAEAAGPVVFSAENGPESGMLDSETQAGESNKAALFAVTHLQRGEYANETHFLIEEDALEQAVIEIVNQPVRALAVMSDGLIRLALKMPSQEPHAPFFQPLFRFITSLNGEPGAAQQAEEQLAVFLNSERVNARTDDDKSLVLAARAQDEP